MSIGITSVQGTKVQIYAHSTWDETCTFVGATFPTIMPGALVDKVTFEIPHGLHAAAFVETTDSPRRMGSGPGTYLDRTPFKRTTLALAWHADSDDYRIVKTRTLMDSGMSFTELERFNPFAVTREGVVVFDCERRINYIWGELPAQPAEGWTSKLVPIEVMLAYIVRRTTLEELDAAAESERKARNELADLQTSKRQLLDELIQVILDLQFAREKADTEKLRAERLEGLLMDLRSLKNYLVFRVVRSRLGPLLKRVGASLESWAARKRAHLKEEEAKRGR